MCATGRVGYSDFTTYPSTYLVRFLPSCRTTRLYRQAGIKQGSSHSGRRSLAAKVLAATGDVETVETIFGHACLDHSKPYLSVDQIVIRRSFGAGRCGVCLGNLRAPGAAPELR